jgi:hypothetical protein
MLYFINSVADQDSFAPSVTHKFCGRTNKELEKELLNATSPFTFWRVNESSVMRFLKLIGCDNGKVGSYAALVKERNDNAHTNGNIFYSTQAALDVKINKILHIVDEIQTYSRPVIEHCYRDFLLNNHDPEEREYADADDQIREILIHGHYLSQNDVKICLEFDTQALREHPGYAEIEELHQCLYTGWGDLNS